MIIGEVEEVCLSYSSSLPPRPRKLSLFPLSHTNMHTCQRWISLHCKLVANIANVRVPPLSLYLCVCVAPCFWLVPVPSLSPTPSSVAWSFCLVPTLSLSLSLSLCESVFFPRLHIDTHASACAPVKAGIPFALQALCNHPECEGAGRIRVGGDVQEPASIYECLEPHQMTCNRPEAAQYGYCLYYP
jgi:hypothetical protein